MKKAGDNILSTAKRLRKRLDLLPVNSIEAQQLLQFIDRREAQWPELLVKYTPSTLLEKDTVQDWIFDNERDIMQHVRGRFSGKYHY
jgi:hypothetical protein